MISTSTAVDIPPEIRAAVQIVAKRHPIDDVPKAFRTLRDYAGFSESEVAKRFSRKPSAVSNWETGQKLYPTGMTRALLELFNIPSEIIDQYINGETAPKFDGQAYKQFDPLELDNEFFLATRGEVLQDVYLRAKAGSANHARIYKEWMIETERGIAARISGSTSIGDTTLALRTRAIGTTSGRRRIAQSTVSEVVTTKTDSNNEIQNDTASQSSDDTVSE